MWTQTYGYIWCTAGVNQWQCHRISSHNNCIFKQSPSNTQCIKLRSHCCKDKDYKNTVSKNGKWATMKACDICVYPDQWSVQNSTRIITSHRSNPLTNIHPERLCFRLCQPEQVVENQTAGLLVVWGPWCSCDVTVIITYTVNGRHLRTFRHLFFFKAREIPFYWPFIILT